MGLLTVAPPRSVRQAPPARMLPKPCNNLQLLLLTYSLDGLTLKDLALFIEVNTDVASQDSSVPRATVSRSALRLTQSPIQWLQVSFSP
jgi:hypothetical protein